MNNDQEKNVILTIGSSHYVLPVVDYRHNRGDDVVGITLKDGARLEVSTDKAILIIGESNFMNAILASSDEDFYQPEQTKHGKTLIKKITKEEPFKNLKNE